MKTTHFWHRIGWIAALAVGLGLLTIGAARAGEDAVVRAVLFYSPTCSHCHYVMEEVLPPLAEKYGEQLVILTIDITQPEGQSTYRETVKALQIPNDRVGVPTLVVGSEVMVGSGEIPERFPGLIKEYLGQGGMDWPAIPGLESYLVSLTPTATLPAAAAGQTLTAAPVRQATSTPAVVWQVPEAGPAGGGPLEAFGRDPLANSLAVLALVVMLAASMRTLAGLRRPSSQPVPRLALRAVLWLALAGLGVAGYLAFVEARQTLAVCGPVGDCNTVQQSTYARLFGVLPVGVMGVGGYLGILAAWWLAGRQKTQTQRLGILALLGLTGAGTLFSMYLTFLEPFVIGATCMWCLSSAILMTGLFVLAGWLYRGIILRPASQGAANRSARQKRKGQRR
ncbi:MAG TPA: vitamin K epoxide reductase family protein [Anaerolineales bacterium]|nr:vitamin K epoxide reductase family protein [Anaerolineales bacterium]